MVARERGREAVVEPVGADHLVQRAPDGACWAGPLPDDGVLAGGAPGVEWLVGLGLAQGQGAPLLARAGGAQADQACAVHAAQAGVGLGRHLAPLAWRQGQGLRRPQGHRAQRAPPACRACRQAGTLGRVEGLAGVKRDGALGQEEGEAGGRLGGKPWGAQAGETRAQGAPSGPLALLAAGGERPAPLRLDAQGQGELTERMTLRRLAAALGEAGPTVAGMQKGVGGGRSIDDARLPPGAARAHPGAPRPLERGKVVRLAPGHVLPATLAAPRRGGSGPQPGAPRPVGPRGAGPLACRPAGAGERREDQRVAHRPRGAPPRRGGRNVGVQQSDASPVWCQGLAQGRSPTRPGLPGPQRRGGRLRRGHSARGTQLLPHALAGAQRDLRAKPRLALEAGRAPPREGRCVCVPCGPQAGQKSCRAIQLRKSIKDY
jgi:hypothetical protein